MNPRFRVFVQVLLTTGATLASQPETARAGDVGTAPAKSDWTMDLSKAKIPDGPAAGKIHGRDFTPEVVEFKNGYLSLRQGRGFFPDLEVKVFPFLKPGEALAGRTIQVDNTSSFANPHIHVSSMPKEKQGATPQTETFMDKYLLILRFDELHDGTIPGRIYLSVPDKSKSFVAGRIVVTDAAKAETATRPAVDVLSRREPRGKLDATSHEANNAIPESPPFAEPESRIGSILAIIGLAVFVFVTIGYWRVYSKAGLPGWGCLIPFYNVVLWMRVGGMPGWCAIWLFIPFVNIVVYCAVAHQIAKNFGKGLVFTVGLVYMPLVFSAILGFGTAQYSPTLRRLRGQSPAVGRTAP